MSDQGSGDPLRAFGLDQAKALETLRQMCEIRVFEERVYDLLGRDLIKERRTYTRDRKQSLWCDFHPARR